MAVSLTFIGLNAGHPQYRPRTDPVFTDRSQNVLFHPLKAFSNIYSRYHLVGYTLSLKRVVWDVVWIMIPVEKHSH